ncbi:hypothetical protein V6U81_21350 [Micromonospora sp. CPCC 205711]|uniref:hypothetical protein n=1 Tax=Micromonospora sp. CPCC 205547 TaxID=3122400 RepID=UPI002FEF2AD7
MVGEVRPAHTVAVGRVTDSAQAQVPERVQVDRRQHRVPLRQRQHVVQSGEPTGVGGRTRPRHSAAVGETEHDFDARVRLQVATAYPAVRLGRSADVDGVGAVQRRPDGVDAVLAEAAAGLTPQ